MGMRQFMFAVGSLGVAIGAVLLLVAVLVVLFLGRELSSTEASIAIGGSCVIGLAWWSTMRSKLARRRSGTTN
jgi:hypothetical protein